MSTTIEIYPTNDFMPTVEQTRARVQELYQELLDRHKIPSKIEVKAFYPSADDEAEIRYVEKTKQWEVGDLIVLDYYINGKWDSSSWPSCSERDAPPSDIVTEAWLEDNPGDKRKLIGKDFIFLELYSCGVSLETIELLERQKHQWEEYRNLGGSAISSTGYGIVAAAIAEATGGVIASWDGAFPNCAEATQGQTAAEFLSWWGDHMINRFGPDRFLRTRMEQ